MREPSNHFYQKEYEEGWEAPPGKVCPYSMSRLGKRCAYLAGQFDRYGEIAWEMAKNNHEAQNNQTKVKKL